MDGVINNNMPMQRRLTEMVIKQRYLYMLHRIKGGYMGGLPWGCLLIHSGQGNDFNKQLKTIPLNVHFKVVLKRTK